MKTYLNLTTGEIGVYAGRARSGGVRVRTINGRRVWRDVVEIHPQAARNCAARLLDTPTGVAGA